LKKILTLATLILCLITVSAQDNIKIKTLRAYPDNDEKSFPVITGGKLTIEFDLAADYIPQISIVFKFCDKNWNPTGNLFLANNGHNTFSSPAFSTLPVTVKEAKYHFKESFPDSKGLVSFPFSGKWMYFVTDAYDTSKVYGKGRFIVITSALDLNTSLKKEKLEDKTYFPTELMYVFNVTSEFNLPQNMYPSYVDHMEVVENQKFDYPYIVDRSFNTNKRQFYWNGDRKFTFTVRDIQPGNEYRQTDFRNTSKYAGPDVKAQFDGIEYSRFYKQGNPDLNGGEILLNFKNDYATYVNVTFSVKPPDNPYKDIFVVGAFSNWDVLPVNKMNEQNGLYSLTIPLKRGIYDYQYVTGDITGNSVQDIDWYYLEGNSWDTTNYYYVFIYYNDPDLGGYDRIIGYSKIFSKQE
jgi:Type 9 secretion system plug protein 1st domain